MRGSYFDYDKPKPHPDADYQVVECSNLDTLTSKVRQLLKDGWVTTGGVALSSGQYFQALTKGTR